MPAERRIFGITGWKNSGKTTLVAALVTELGRRGLTVSTVKHAHHSFDIDREGTDSWKHRKAGTKETLLVSGVRWALMHEFHDEEEPPIEAMLEKMAPCDIILIEGYKRESHAKIEVIRGVSGKDSPRWPEDETIVAIAAENRQEGCTLPCFSPDDVAGIAGFIITHCGIDLPARKAGGRHAAE